jgi:hypothetical protein
MILVFTYVGAVCVALFGAGFGLIAWFLWVAIWARYSRAIAEAAQVESVLMMGLIPVFTITGAALMLRLCRFI